MPPNALIKPVALTKPKPQVAAYGNVPSLLGNYPGAPDIPAYLQAPAPAAATPPPPPPPPPDFNALVHADAGYNTNEQDITAQNTLTLADLLKGYMRGSQGAQDNANAHGALFSGAAVNAQRSAAQDYADQQARQAANVLGARHQNYQSAWDRLVQQLAGGS